MDLSDGNCNETLEQVILISTNEGHSKVFTSKKAKGYNVSELEVLFKEFTCCLSSDEAENFTFFTLDNQYVLLRTKKEKDKMIYHGVIKEKGYFDYYPIQYYDCNFFKDFDYDNLNLEEGNLSSVKDLKVNSNINYNEIMKFLMRTSYSGVSKSHIRIIKRLLNSLIQSIEENKSFIIKDDISSRSLWIAAVQMSMTKELAHSITFSLNYNQAKSDLVRIIGFDENNQGLLEVYINQGDRFQVHDLICGIESKVKCTSEFSKLVQIAYSISLEALVPFIEFLSKTEYLKFDKEIDNCYDLFKLMESNFVNSELIEIIHAIDFLDKYSSLEMRDEILRIIEIRVFSIDEYIEKEIIERLILFITKTASFTGREAYFKKAYKLLFQYINVLIDTCDYLSIKEIEEYYYDIINKLGSGREYLRVYFSGKENIKRVNEFISEENMRAVKFYYPIINEVSKLIKNNYDDSLLLLNKKCKNILEKNYYKFQRVSMIRY
ncbi:MAG: hypothetical protein AB6733_12735 [Clostridiaceae bacterium]